MPDRRTTANAGVGSRCLGLLMEPEMRPALRFAVAFKQSNIVFNMNHRARIAELQKSGVRFGECARAARDNGWTNSDLLAATGITTSANLRLVQLVQEGFA